MPVLLNAKTYGWLKNIGVFHNHPIPTQKQQISEVPYDEEIYLQNGYLVGVALRKFVRPYSDEYQQLLKIRKIATLKSSQNWQIIEPFLNKIGCSISGIDENQSEVTISVTEIADILEYLYEQYSPKEEQKIRLAKRARNNFIDIYNFDSEKPLNEAENTLELVCILLVRNLKITLGEAMGLLMDRCKYLKKLIVQGSKRDQFQSIVKLYQDVTASWAIVQQFLSPSSLDLDKILEGLSEGVLSENRDVIHLTLNLLSYVTDEQWFIKYGYYKLLTSTYIQCFNFTIERLSPHYERILNENLHTRISDKVLLFTILQNLIKTVPKTIYAKEIFLHLPLSYYYEQCYSVLNVEEIDQQPPKVVSRAKELLARLMTTFVDKIPHNFVPRIVETFKYNGNRAYGESYHNLALLFEILEAFMLKQSVLLEKFFKLCMKYLSSTFGETRHWIIDNLKYLYGKMGKFFPVGCMLGMYSMDLVAQADEYSLFLLIAEDQNSLSVQECTLTIGYLITYIQSQLHCKCFLNILKLFLANHPKASVDAIQQVSMRLLQRMTLINIPMLNQGEINILNPKPPVKNRIINSIGIKRKQMLKFGEYELGKSLLELLADVQDKEFLSFYVNAISHTIMGIEKQIGHKKKQLTNLLKMLRKKAKMAFEAAHEPQPMAQIVKSILVNRSAFSNSVSNQHYTPLSQSKLMSESVMISDYYHESPNTKMVQNSVIKEQQEPEEQEGEENQFIPDFQNKEPIQSTHIDNEILGKEGHLADFTEGQKQEEGIFLLTPAVLEQNQIAYINVVKQKSRTLLGQCSEIYKECLRQTKQIDLCLKKFLKQLGISRLISLEVAEQLLLKCRTLSSIPNQTIQNFLIQLAFYVFAFKQNRRVAVTCVSSFFTILEENIRAQQQNSSQRKQTKDLSLFNKSIQFEYNIRRPLESSLGKVSQTVSKNKIESYLVCFQVLSNILYRKMGFNLIEPYSRQVNQFAVPPQQTPMPIAQEHGISPQRSLSENPLESELEQLEYLAEQLDEPENEPAYRIKKPTKKKIKTLAVKQQHRPMVSPKHTDNKELRNKLAKRMKILNEELIKNGKNLGNLVKKDMEMSGSQTLEMQPQEQ